MLKIDDKNHKVVGIIMECNPFHNGHKRLIRSAKQYGDIVVAIMSGNYVQRGEPAIYDKYKRTKQLLSHGVDLVIELPLIYTLSSANLFAFGAVSILDELKFIDYLIFGSKIADISKLTEIANLDIDDNIEIKTLLKDGNSYPIALSKAINKKLSGNDILGVEYIRAISKLHSKIIPITIKRKSDLKTATELRKNISKKITCDSFSDILNYKLLQYRINSNLELNDIYLLNSDVKNSILNTLNSNLSFTKSAKKLNTKNRTLANIKRIFFNIIFDIQKKDIYKVSDKAKASITKLDNKSFFIRILGVKKSSAHILKHIKIPYLTGYTISAYKTFISKYKSSKVIKCNKKGEYIPSPLLKKYIFADDLYYLLSGNKTNESLFKFTTI